MASRNGKVLLHSTYNKGASLENTNEVAFNCRKYSETVAFRETSDDHSTFGPIFGSQSSLQMVLADGDNKEGQGKGKGWIEKGARACN